MRAASLVLVLFVPAAVTAASPPTAIDNWAEIHAHRLGPAPVIRSAEAQPMQGIELHIVVNPDGTVASATVAGQSSVFDEEAVSKGRQLRYKPFERDGHPIAAEFSESVRVLPPEKLPIEHTPFPEVRDSSSVVIELERTTCFGTCPDYKLRISEDGTVEFNGRGFVAVSGQHRGRISRADFDKLVDSFRKADFYSLARSYHAIITDNPTYRVAISVDGQAKSVTDYAGESIGMPAAVTDLENEIDRLADTAKWITGND